MVDSRCIYHSHMYLVTYSNLSKHLKDHCTVLTTPEAFESAIVKEWPEDTRSKRIASVSLSGVQNTFTGHSWSTLNYLLDHSINNWPITGPDAVRRTAG